MEKFELKDIELIGEGRQIRRYIEDNYGKVGDFYETVDFGLELKSVRTYLSQDTVRSHVFRHAIVRILDKGYYDLVTPMSVQIKKYVWNIHENIKLYKYDDDYKIFDKLLAAAQKEQMIMESAIMYRAKAMNCFYRNRIYQTIEWYEKAIELLKGYDMDKLVLMQVELADACYREGILDKAEIEYKNAGVNIKKNDVSKETQFKYYYWHGIMLNNTHNHSKARISFVKAYNITGKNEEKATTLFNIALAYRRDLNYQEALNHYNKLFSFYTNKDLAERGAIYNNIAIVHLEQGNFIEALKNSAYSLTFICLTNDLRRKLIFTHTFIKIKLRMGEEESIMEYLALLRDTIYGHVDKIKIIEDLTTLVEDLDNVEQLNQLSTAIMELIENTENQEYKQGLLIRLGEIKIKKTKIKSGEVLK